MSKKLNVVSYTFAAVAGLSFAVGLAVLAGEMRV